MTAAGFYSESDYDVWLAGPPPAYPTGRAGTRSRSSPPLRRDPLDFGVFSAHDLHAANEKRASRRDLADLRNQLFVRSTNDLGARSNDRRRASGRDLLTNWRERQHCDKCNAHTLKRHSVSHQHLHHPNFT